MMWQKLAKTLPSGRAQRIDCPNCGCKRTALVTNMGHEGIRAYCFRNSCDLSEWEPEPGLTLAERQAQLAASQEAAQEPLKLPRDYTTAIPTRGAVWHLRGGVSCSTAEAYGFGWSEKMQRVIIPIWTSYDASWHKELAYWQGRAIDRKTQPKYLNPFGVDRHGILFGFRKTKHVVLTEDILSAIRINSASRDDLAAGMAVLGTRIAEGMVGRILATGAERVSIWMDPDGAGHNMRRDLSRKLALVLPDGAVNVVHSDREAKQMSNAEILEVLADD